MESRPYQIKAVNSVSNALNRGVSRQLLVMATGCGKSKCGIDIIDDLQLKRVLWLSDRQELISQSGLAFIRNKFDESLYNHVKEIGFLKFVTESKGSHAGPGFRMGAIKSTIFEPNANVVMGSIATMWRRLDRFDEDYFDGIICDEAHLYASRTAKMILEKFKPKLLLGLTATPWRGDSVSLGSIFDEIVFEYPIEQGIKEGYLCELDGVKIRTNIDLDNVKTIGGDFNEGQLSQEVNTPSRNFLIADSYLKYAKGRQGIVFAVDIEHAMALAEAFIEKGINATAVSSKEELTGNRSQKIQDYLNRKIDVLVNVSILVAGFDAPNTGIIIQACPTKSLTKWMQQTGRGTRLKDDEYVSKFGQNCIIMDVVDNTSKHSLINAWNLDKGLDPTERVYITNKDREKLIEARRVRIEGKTNKDERVQLLPIMTPKFKTTIKSTELIDEAQKKHLQYLGYSCEETVYTKENYREIIGSFPADSGQLKDLQKWGFNISQPITRAQASYTLYLYQNNKIKVTKK